LAELNMITIANNAPHVHLIEGGSSRQAPNGVFRIAEQRATMIFDRLAVSSQ
jgi:hypothetical protein